MASIAQTATNIAVGTAVQQASVNRLGVNLGDETYYDSGQLLKNLIFQNPGFEPMKYRSIMVCAVATANTCVDDNNYSPQPTGFWTGGTYSVITGTSAGLKGTIVSSTMNPSTCSGCGQIIQFDQNVNMAVGDYFVLTNSFTGGGDLGWWDNTSGGGTISSETTDLSPETPGTQALVLNAATTGTSVLLTQYFDGEEGLSFIQLNGTFKVTFRAKGIGGTNKMNVSVLRLGSTTLNYLNQTQTLTNTWQDYTMTFTAAETGTATGTVQLVFNVAGAAVELDDVDLEQTNSSASNTTPFRDDVVNALKELNPGSIRMMAAGAALGSDIPNQLQVPYARYREGFSTGQKTEGNVAYGIHEFLQLCQAVGADPWITIPTATTPAEMQDFIEYLTGTGSDAWSALRVSRGQTTPWTSVFNKIHIELGNETWNGQFRGESMTYDGYPYWANTVFGAARATPGYVASSFDLVLDGFVSSPGYNGVLLARSTQHDSLDVAPYLLYSANNEAQATMFGALFAEPELYDTTGEVAKDFTTVAAAPTPTYLNVYETNLSPVQGSITETQLNALTPSVGAGLAHTVHMLQMMRLGVQYQNAFSLPQFNFLRSDGNLVRLWGTVVDMGTTNRRRPQFHTQSMANAAIGGAMLQTLHTGANPTWNQPLSSDNVLLNGAHYLQSFAFQNGSVNSTIIFNLNLTTALPVTFSGANAPSGSVTMTQITSTNVTDNNETSNVVVPATSTLSAFNPATGLTLPPFSMTVLTTTGTATPAPALSVQGGTYTTAQTVSISDASSGAAIYYTTDGSAPSTASNLYSGAMTVSSNMTLNAIAVASGLSPSAVTSATYVFTSPTVATPVFSVAGGTYTSAQTVGISDTTTGATIYYTTDGTTPTTASSAYTGAVTVSATETLKAIAVATGDANSAVATATYTIGASKAATPTVSVAGDTYPTAQTVAIKDATAGAVIYYTTNGMTPTTASTKYTGAFTVGATETLEAIAVAPNYANSSVMVAYYVIKKTAATPTFSVVAGTYVSSRSVTIADATSGAEVYYTTNGATPTTASTKYTGEAIPITATLTLQAVATASNYLKSAVAKASYVIDPTTVSKPTFSVAGGTYTSAQTVTMADATSGVSIYYTTNGTTPTTASTKYTAAIKVSANETLKALAAKTGMTTSAVVSAAYVIESVTDAPVPSLAAGTYLVPRTVTLSDGTSDAVIYYTTTGTTPTTASTKYTAAIAVSKTMTIKAMAVATGHTASGVTSLLYTITPEASAPTFSLAAGTYAVPRTVTLKTATVGAAIHYTTNGLIPTVLSTTYKAPIMVGKSMTIRAISTLTGDVPSTIAVAEYTIKATVATPTFSLAAGTYAVPRTVTLKSTTADAVIYYTTNGTNPTTASTKYAEAIAVSKTLSIRAMAVAAGDKASAISSAKYTISATVAAPTFSLTAGTYDVPRTVTLKSTTAGAVIYYTTNLATPTTASTKYTGAITVGKTMTIKAMATATGDTPSAVVKSAYVIAATAVAPTFSVAAGSYAVAQKVVIKDATAGAVIYYTLNGTEPTTSSTKYVSALTVSKTESLKAIAVVPEGKASALVTAKYEITSAVTAPTFSIAAGTYSGTQTVAIKDATVGAVIYYTTNGTTPTTASTKYAGAIKVSTTATVKALAEAKGAKSSTVASAKYSIEEPAATPLLSLKSGTYTTKEIVKLTDATPGAVIYYTTNGTTPTTASAKYTGAITVSKNLTITAMATAAEHTESAVARAAYVVEIKAADVQAADVQGDSGAAE